MERNGWLKLLVGLIITLILGGYGYTYTATGSLESKIVQRLDRIEGYLLEIIKERARRD